MTSAYPELIHLGKYKNTSVNDELDLLINYKVGPIFNETEATTKLGQTETFNNNQQVTMQ